MQYQDQETDVGTHTYCSLPAYIQGESCVTATAIKIRSCLAAERSPTPAPRVNLFSHTHTPLPPAPPDLFSTRIVLLQEVMCFPKDLTEKPEHTFCPVSGIMHLRLTCPLRTLPWDLPRAALCHGSLPLFLTGCTPWYLRPVQPNRGRFADCQFWAITNTSAINICIKAFE